jgi:hypothetical protein
MAPYSSDFTYGLLVDAGVREGIVFSMLVAARGMYRFSQPRS